MAARVDVNVDVDIATRFKRGCTDQANPLFLFYRERYSINNEQPPQKRIVGS